MIIEPKEAPPMKKENVTPNQPLQQEKPKPAMTTSILKKSVKISDDGFLKSMRDHFTLKNIHFGEELKFFITDDDDTRMKLSELHTNLMSKGIF